MAGESARLLVAEALAEGLRPREELDLPTWMERKVVLRREESIDSPGRYSRERSLPMAKLFALFNGSPEYWVLIVRKGSQSAFTLHCLGDVVMHVAEDPQNMIFVIDSQEQARRLSRTRLQPILADCEETAGLWEEHEDAQALLHFRFPGMGLTLGGAGSAGQLASLTAGRSYADEVDKHPRLRGEARSLALLRQRGKEVKGMALIAGSTPTEEDGQITVEWAKGSRHVFRVPCPHCGGRQVLEIENPEESAWPLCFESAELGPGRWDLHRVLRETYYECRRCGGEIRDGDKLEMNRAGEWEPTYYSEDGAEGVPVKLWEPGVLSAQTNDLYSVSPNSTFGHLAVEWIQARNDPKRMQDFLNGRLGLPVKAQVFSVKPSGLRRLCGPYARGTMPEVPVCLTIQADNQGAERVKWMVSGWNERGDQYIVDWGEVDRRREMDRVRQREYQCGDRWCRPQRGAMDEGGEDETTWEVRQFCAERFPFWIPLKGRGRNQIDDLTRFRDCKLARGGTLTVPVLQFADNAFKGMLYRQKIANFDPARVEREGLSRLWLPRDATEQLFRELSGEELRRVEGKVRWVASPPNDFGDCCKMGYVLWNTIGPQLTGG